MTSALKVTEDMEIFSINHVPYRVKALIGIIPYNKIPKRQMTATQAGTPKPAVQAQSLERNPVDKKSALLKMTENDDWFKYLDVRKVKMMPRRMLKSFPQCLWPLPCFFSVLKSDRRQEREVTLVTAKKVKAKKLKLNELSRKTESQFGSSG